MSTRSSITYHGGLHIFREVLSDEICFELDDFALQKINNQYGCPVINLEDLRCIKDDIEEYLKYHESR